MWKNERHADKIDETENACVCSVQCGEGWGRWQEGECRVIHHHHANQPATGR